MFIPELNCEVKDAEELAEAFSEMLDDFCDALGKEPGATREMTEDDPYIENCKFMWSDSSMRAISAEEKRLYNLAQTYYPGEDTPIETSRMREG